ncbi:serine/threonine-protein kinase [Actinoplanes sp. NPDC023714]|uniref:serine/threonine-protein kinase n=1 Tax=Actinoplanes sp. NPDC023714 TaxID=3154322 RepID=UPI00340DA7D4
MVPVGEVVAGRYRIVRPLANGGMSHVWLASDDRAGVARQVALKQCTIPDGLAPAQRDVVRQWAFPEARAAARVRHPNVIHTLEVCPDAAGPWIVMEYVPSRSLQEIVESEGALPAARVAEIGLALLAALTAAHDAGVLHLDVKPGNVLIGDDGRVVLTDFGPAVTAAGITALTDAGVVLGSPKYIAPERLFEHSSTVASDLWSLGATLYHAVEGRPPFIRPSTTGVLRALADTEPEPPRQAGLLTPVLTGLLRRDPATRLTPADLEAKLRRAAGLRKPRTWWRPRRLRRGLPEPAHEATAAERGVVVEPVAPGSASSARSAASAGAGSGSGAGSTDPHGPTSADNSDLSDKESAGTDRPAAESEPASAVMDASPAVMDASPVVMDAAPAGTDAGPADESPQKLGRSVDEPADLGRPWLRRRLTAAAAVIVLLALFAAVAANARGRHGPAEQPPRPPAVQALPDDFGWWADPSGFRVAVPEGWRPDPRADGVVAFADPEGGATLRVSRWPGPAGDLVAGLLAQEEEIRVPAYRRLRIEALPKAAGAVWEYTFLDGDKNVMRGLHQIVANGAESYLIEWRTARDSWLATLPQLTVVLSTFVP